MKHQQIHMPNLSCVAAYVIGVILFAAIWKWVFGSASSQTVLTVLAGMAGVAIMIAAFWIRNEIQPHKPKEK